MTKHYGAWLVVCVALGVPPSFCFCADIDSQLRLSTAMQVLLVEAEVGTTNEFDKYKREKNLLPECVAPSGLRMLIRPPQIETWSRVFLDFRWDDKQISLIWNGELRVVGDYDKSKKTLVAAMRESEFADAPATLGTHLRQEYEYITKINEHYKQTIGRGRSGPSPPLTFGRLSGKTTHEVLFPAFSGLIGGYGGEEKHGGEFKWCVATGYDGDAPTLSDLITVLPVIRPVYLEPALYNHLRTQPVYFFRTDCSEHRLGVAPNQGWQMLTSATVRPRLEDAMKKQGFVLVNESKQPNPERYGESVSINWQRDSDLTFVHIVVWQKDKDRIEIIYQTPQQAAKP